MLEQSVRRWLVLEVLADGEPIQGCVHCDAAPDREFVGWIGLAAALEAARLDGGVLEHEASYGGDTTCPE